VTLDSDRISRYSRQLVIPSIGPAGQERLAEARVRVVGASAAAVPGILYLTLAGAGTIWIEDPEPVGPSDAGHWLFPPDSVGAPREKVAAEALQARSRFVCVEPWRAGATPTATLVLAVSRVQAVAAAENSRRARVPHVAAEVDGEGGAVISIPVGAPCYACARSAGATPKAPAAGAAALTSLAAEELVLMLADPAVHLGRRIDLTRGIPTVRATSRLAGCACGTTLGGGVQAI
jgi:hypothetical protein